MKIKNNDLDNLNYFKVFNTKLLEIINKTHNGKGEFIYQRGSMVEYTKEDTDEYLKDSLIMENFRCMKAQIRQINYKVIEEISKVSDKFIFNEKITKEDLVFKIKQNLYNGGNPDLILVGKNNIDLCKEGQICINDNYTNESYIIEIDYDFLIGDDDILIFNKDSFTMDIDRVLIIKELGDLKDYGYENHIGSCITSSFSLIEEDENHCTILHNNKGEE